LYFCSPLTSLSFSPLSWLLAPSLVSLYVFFYVPSIVYFNRFCHQKKNPSNSKP
jgi:hypothetical protein